MCGPGVIFGSCQLTVSVSGTETVNCECGRFKGYAARMDAGTSPIAHVCVTCGVQTRPTAVPPVHCPICEDERQYVGHGGQRWTTAEVLRDRHVVTLTPAEPGLFQVVVQPRFAIGQRPLIVQTDDGNIMWDCTAVLTEPIVAAIGAIGGISAIAISHPHFSGAMVDWSHAFDGVPIFVPSADRQWVMRPDPVLHFWEGDRQPLMGGVSVVRCGGHFDGSSVLHWLAGADGRGVLLSGDTIAVTDERRWVSVMRSYPNLIPIGAGALRRMERALVGLQYDRIYGGWEHDVVDRDARDVVARSIARYRAAIAE